jgi:hypothetical protein
MRFMSKAICPPRLPKLTTTELYTRVSINLLKQVYLATHPGALQRPAVKAAAAAELMAALDAEADAEDV